MAALHLVTALLVSALLTPARAAAVCGGLPSQALLGSTGIWPAGCSGTVAVNEWCQGTCTSGIGSPRVMCQPGPTPSWGFKVVGGCRQAPYVCDGEPNRILNGRWPITHNVPAGVTITGVCNSGYYAAGFPTSTCGLTGWSAPSPIQCLPGAAVNFTAFVPHPNGLGPPGGGGAGQLSICSLTPTGALQGCAASDGSANGGQPLWWYGYGVAAYARTVWTANIARLSRCTWVPGANVLSQCRTLLPASVNVLVPAYDPSSDTLFVGSSSNNPAVVTVCPGASTMTNMAGCTTKALPFASPSCAALGVAVAGDFVYISGGYNCPTLLVCNAGGDPLAACAAYSYASVPGVVGVQGVAVSIDYGSSDASYIFLTVAYSSGYSSMLRCPVNTPGAANCAPPPPTSDNFGLYNSVSLPGTPMLYMPTQFASSVTTCAKNTDAVAGPTCTASVVTSTTQSVVALAVVPYT